MAYVTTDTTRCNLDVGIGNIFLDVLGTTAKPPRGVIISAIIGKLEGLVFDIEGEDGVGPGSPGDAFARRSVCEYGLGSGIELGLSGWVTVL